MWIKGRSKSNHQALRGLLLFIIVLMSFCFGYTSLAETKEYSITLNGLHKFKPGDDLKWADLEFDDSSDWLPIKAPCNWQAQGIKPKDGMGWYRIHFFAPKPPREMDLGVSLGSIGNSDETYLNGIPIGGEGVVGRRFVDATYVERLYRIPNALVRFDQNNVLAIRVMNTYWYGGIYTSGDLKIGEYRSLQIDKLSRSFRRKAEEIVYLSIGFLVVISCLLVYIAGMREPEYVYFGATFILYLLLYILESLFFYETGLRTGLIQRLTFFLYSLLTISAFCFVMAFFGYSFNRWIKYTLFCFSILSVVILFYANHSYQTLTIIQYIWYAGVNTFCVIGGYFAIKAISDRRHESIPIALGVFSLILAALAETINSIGSFRLHEYSDSEYFFIFFAMFVMYALILRFIRFRNRSKTLSARILTAHEEERKRLARELHDGLGQNLLAIQLNLQQANQEFHQVRIETAIQELTGSIEELRDISMGLSPPFLENVGLCGALRMYAEKFTENTGIKVRVLDSTGPIQSQRVKENLFRIFQEAIGNATKHSEGREIRVEVKTEGKKTTMEIKDDGKGFDHAGGLSDGKGIGLSTIRERVSLLGGILKIKSGPGIGTAIRVEVNEK